jgi:uncharacterized protein YciI
MIVPILLLASLSVFQAPQTAPAEGPPLTLIRYQLVILKKGPADATAKTPEGQTIVKEHIAHMYKLAADGLNMASGPVADGGEIQALMIVKVATPEQAVEIESADPAVKAGLFTVEAIPFMSPEGWFGKWAEFGKFESVYFGFLTTGPNPKREPEAAKKLQADHLAYMDEQSKQGKLVVAGPIMVQGPRRGIIVYRVATMEEAKQRAEADPAVKAGRLAVELFQWQVAQGALPAHSR